MTRLRREIWRFGAVGVVGFVVDASVLVYLVQVMGWGLYGSRAISFGLAVTATWYLNRRFTFAQRAGAKRGQEYGRYFLAQVVGALINLGVYVAIVEAIPAVAAYPVLPLAAGSGVAMVFNFLAARYFAFVRTEVAQSPFSSCGGARFNGEP
jgi:putative flippase GtrA